jgi:hypothetical protein
MKSVTCTATIFGRGYPGAGATVGPGAVFAFLAGPNTRVKALLLRTRARSGSGTEFGSVGRRPGHPDGRCWGKRKSAGAAARFARPMISFPVPVSRQGVAAMVVPLVSHAQCSNLFAFCNRPFIKLC